MDELATKLVDSLTKVENALETMAPTAFQALVEAASIEGTLGLWGIGFLVLFFLCCVGGLVLSFVRDNEGLGVVSMVLGLFASGIFGLSIFASDIILKVSNPTAYVIKSLLAQ